MIVAAALAWYAETPESLTRCVQSLAGYCDTLTALGGRWEGFPPVPKDNPEAQAQTIVDACEEIDIDYEVGLGSWSSQVEKRAELMAQAREGSDWVLVIDADEFIERGDPRLFRKGLAGTDRDVARIFTYRPPITYGRQVHRVYRSTTGVSVVTAHNGYVTSDGRFLNGNPCYVQLEPTEDLGELLVIAHDLTCRIGTRKSARAEYLRFRRKEGIESWV